MKLLNIGCGTNFHPDWFNIDFRKTGKEVVSHNLLKGIPFQDDFFNVVYHSHFIEHFDSKNASFLMEECRRVLKKNGVIRISTPDLELLAQNYLKALENASKGGESGIANYEWTIIHLFDQFKRNLSGGDMINFIQSKSISNLDFVTDSIGPEILAILEEKNNKKSLLTSFIELVNEQGLLHSLSYSFHKYNMYKVIKNLVLKIILGAEYRLLEIGRFRECGECHVQLYDRFSLHKLLENSGFSNVYTVQADVSRIQGWNAYQLDINKKGIIIHPDSIYVEGIKQYI